MQISGQYIKGISFESKDKAAKQLEENILKESGVKDYFYIDQNKDGFILYIDLKPKTERKNAEDGSKKIVQRLFDSSNGIKEFSDLTVKEIAMGPPSGDWQIQIQLADSNMANLKEAAIETGQFLSKQEHVIKVDDGFTDKGNPGVAIVLDREKMGISGLSSLEVGTQLKSILDQTKVGKFEDPISGEQEEIFLANQDKYNSTDELKKIPLLSRAGTMIFLADIAKIEERQNVNAIERYNGSRYVTIKARLDDEQNAALVQKKLNDFATKEKLKSWSIDQKLNKGDIADMTKSFTELGVALLIAILLTYIVLVLQFSSFSLPVIMLFTIPLSFIVVFPALWHKGSYFGFL
jgi:HAE1 family hydrophobic/amphiphilic exporter-1